MPDLHIQIVSAILGTCFNNRGTIQMIRADGINDEVCFLGKIAEIVLIQLSSFNA